LNRRLKTGVFAHLKKVVARASGRIELLTQTLSWEKFARTVLPGAAEIVVQIPMENGPYFGLTTAANPMAQPILQWDLEPRNPVSWYFYLNGSPASQWGLVAGQWRSVTAVFMNPAHWHHPAKFGHHAHMAMLALAGCRDLQHKAGGGFFAEQLRAEYHEIRSVMDNYANQAEIASVDEGGANGIAIQSGTITPMALRVTTALGTATYQIDRLD